MARKVLVSPHVSKLMQHFYESEEVLSYGLILGHFDGKDVMAVHLARTPNEEGETEENQVAKINDIDEVWLAEHIKQVQNMLPGGMNIQGMFVASKENPFSCKNKIIACLNKIDKSKPLPLMYLNPKSKECAIQNMTTAKSISFEVVDLNWVCLKASLILDQPLAFTADGPLKEKLNAAVTKLEKPLEKAEMLINGRCMGKNELLVPVSKESKKSGGKKGNNREDSATSCDDDDGDGNQYKTVKDLEVDILFGPECSDLQDTVTSDVCAKMRIMGRMSARAFASPHCSVETGLQYLREDILRTFKARLNMHCDSLVGEETAGTDVELPILHEPPRRINIRLPASPITVSDFLFPGEAPEESVKAVEEMLGFTPNFEHLDDELEIVASPQTIRMEDDSESRAESPVLETTKAQNSCSSLQIVLSIIVVLAAIGASFFLTMTPDDEDSVTIDTDEAFAQDFAQENPTM